MDDQQIDTTLTSIFRSLFRKPDLELRDDLTARDVQGWDSLNHVNLIIQIEEQFGIRFRNDEVARLANVGDLRRLVREKLQARV
jgi:acyl carrier protein